MAAAKLASALVRSLFSHHSHEPEDAQFDNGCPVCDHPFGHMAHMCLSSGSPIGIAS